MSIFLKPLLRRSLLACAVMAALPAFGQAYPNKPVRVIVPQPPGGGFDTVGRLIADRMSRLSGQSFVVENRTGSGTRAAMEDYLREHHLHIGPTMELPSNETIKQAVMAGLGVSLMSLHSLGIELRQGAIAVPEVEGLPVLRRWYLVKNHGKTLSPAAEAFRYFVLEQAQARLQRLTEVARPA
jgi:DNA-binding transcriptional LysR family regulator